MAELLGDVTSLGPSDTRLMPDYVIPTLQRAAMDPDPMVRCELARNICRLATTAHRFLEMAQWVRTLSERQERGRGEGGSEEGGGDGFGALASAATLRSFDAELSSLQEQVLRIVQQLATDHADGHSAAVVKRNLLVDVASLALFLRRQNTNDRLLPLLITFLNDRDAALRVAFAKHIVGVCAFVGRTSLEAFLLPCMLQFLTDVEETVVVASLDAFARLVRIKALQSRSALLDIARRAAPLLCHPNAWIRHAALGYMQSLGKHLTLAEVYAHVRPLLQPFLTSPLYSLDFDLLRASLQPAPSRSNYDRALACAAEQQRLQSHGDGSFELPRLGDSITAYSADENDLYVDAMANLGVGGTGEDGRAGGTGEGLGEESAVEDRRDDAYDTAAGTSERPRVDAFNAISTLAPNLASELPPEAQSGDGAARGRSPKPPRLESTTSWDFPPRETAASASDPDRSSAASDKPLDLSLIADLDPKESAILQAMRKYIRVAAVAKLAKIRMWESDNLAMLQSGGGELMPFRTLSERIPVQRLVAPPSALGAPEAACDTAVSAEVRTPDVVTYSPVAASPSSGDVSAPGALAPSPTGRAGGSVTSTPPRPAFSASTLFGRKASQRPRLPSGAAATSSATTDTNFPTGRRLPAASTKWQPRGTVLAEVRAHDTGVRGLAASVDGRYIYTYGRGRGSMVKLWALGSIERDKDHAVPLAAHGTDGDSGDIVAAAGCPGTSRDLALAMSDGVMQVLAAARLGGADAIAYQMRTAPELGRIVAMGARTGDGVAPLLYTTESGTLVATDARSARNAWTLQHERRLGLLQTLEYDASSNWLVSASSSGRCTLWDVRYGVRLSTWSVGRRVHCASHVRLSETASPLLLLGTEGNAVEFWKLGESPQKSLELSASADAVATEHSVRAVLASTDGGTLVTASTDRVLRCWNPMRSGAGADARVLGREGGDAPPTFAWEVGAEGVRVLREASLPAATDQIFAGGGRTRTLAADCGESRAALTSAAFLGDAQSSLIAAGSLDGFIRFWR